MLKALSDRLTSGMLWWLVIPSSVLISALAVLAFSYAHVAWNAKKISSEVRVGNVTAKIEAQVQMLSASVDQQQIQTNKSISLVEKLFTKTEYKATSVSRNKASEITDLTASDLADVISNLKIQSAVLNSQKKNLIEINKNLQEFKQELKNYPNVPKK